VQSTGCAPIPKAFDEGKPASEAWANAATLAAGLRVPKAYGDYIILDILRKSGGTAVAVTDAEIMDALRSWAETEGIFAARGGVAQPPIASSGQRIPEAVTVLFMPARPEVH
jgi:threonine synthase